MDSLKSSEVALSQGGRPVAVFYPFALSTPYAYAGTGTGSGGAVKVIKRQVINRTSGDQYLALGATAAGRAQGRRSEGVRESMDLPCRHRDKFKFPLCKFLLSFSNGLTKLKKDW
jgi:hypothetical protein